MQLTINGKIEKINVENFNLSALLKEKNIVHKVIIELNKKIIKEEQFDKTYLKDNDILEILYFMGGG